MKTIAFMADSIGDTPRPAPAPANAPPKPGSLEAPPPAPLLWSPFRGTVGAPTELLVLLGVIFALGAVLFGWALLFRRRSRNSLSRHAGAVFYEGHEKPSGGRRRRRSRQAEERPRNPTLKERGGLPPRREDEPPPNPLGAEPKP